MKKFLTIKNALLFSVLVIIFMLISDKMGNEQLLDIGAYLILISIVLLLIAFLFERKGIKLRDQERKKVKAASDIQSIDKDNQEENKLEGFSGWLLLFGFGIFIAPVFSLGDLLVNFKAVGFNFFTFTEVLILLSLFWLLYLMLKRKKSFRKWFLGIGIGMIVITGLDAASVTMADFLTPEQIQDFYIEFIRTVIYVIIWSLYLWRSKRANNTFIK